MARNYITSNMGAFLRNPRGGVEGVGEMKAAGTKWLAVNLGDGFEWTDWTTVVSRGRALGVQVFPWQRCRTIVECYDLLDVADRVGFRAILNLENELETTCPPNKVAEVMADFPDLVVSFSCNGWLPNDVDFRPIAHRPVLLQLFPTDMKRNPTELPQLELDCRKHAADKGFKFIGITAQTYAGAQPSWYAYMNERPHSFYTGDDIGAGNWAAWV